MFTFGFSYVGVIYLLMLMIPNIIWTKNLPAGYTSEGESKVLGTIEKIGQVLCTCCVLIFSEFNIRATGWVAWLVISFALMVIYDLAWLRYFKSSKTLIDMYKPFLGIPVPLASLPVMAFFLLGIYGTNIFLIDASVFLSIGHVGIHMEHAKKLDMPKSKRSVKIIKTTLLVLFLIICAVVCFFIGARNINYMKHYRLINHGVDESIYVELGGQEQYLLIRGADKTNPVIILLHGGPSSPESYVNYSWVDNLVDDYTIVDWDQRGCGRTYVLNKDIDPDNTTATYEQALIDLDDLVDYARERFKQDKVIIVGHSYGTVLASSYMEQHPEKVSSYVAIAQVVSMDINNRTLADMALANALSNGENPTALNNALSTYNMNSNVTTTMLLRNEAMKLLPAPLPEKSTWLALTSPYMGWGDFVWFMYQLGPMEDYLAMNKQLYDSLLDFDLYDVERDPDIKITYISGSLDYACPVSTIEDYLTVTGSDAELLIIDDCGHNVQYTEPQQVGEMIKSALG